MDEDLWDAYDRMGPSFEQHAADSAYNAHYDRPAVLAALGPVAGRQVLDAACGPGLYLRALLELGAEVTAFDASPVMVSLARQQTAGRVRIDQAALGKPLPYPDDAFDLIVCALAIHYASDRAAAFAEFRRVLRPGGAAVISTQHPVMDWLRKGGSYFQATLETDIWHTPSGDQPVQFWRESLSALCTAATDAGFLIEKVIEPVPAETMRERYPDDYEKLSKEPGFLILRLLKPARPAPGPRPRGMPGRAAVPRRAAVPALSWIGDERIAISAVPPVRTVALLAEQGVTHVVNCRPRAQVRWSGDLAAERAAFGPGQVAHAPMQDHGLRQRPAAWAAAARFAARVLDDQPQAGVLIHCTAGRRRSVMVAYAVLRLRGHDRARAAELVLRYRTGAVLVPAYVRSVERWLAAAAR